MLFIPDGMIVWSDVARKGRFWGKTRFIAGHGLWAIRRQQWVWSPGLGPVVVGLAFFLHNPASSGIPKICTWDDLGSLNCSECKCEWLFGPIPILVLTSALTLNLHSLVQFKWPSTPSVVKGYLVTLKWDTLQQRARHWHHQFSSNIVDVKR